MKNSVRGQQRFGTADDRFHRYEVSPTLPERDDKQRDNEVSKAIAEWKIKHKAFKAH